MSDHVTESDLERAGMAGGPSHFFGHACPVCHVTHDGVRDATGLGRKPSKGDLSICGGCGTVLVFCADLSVRVPKADEWDALPESVRAELAEGVRLVQRAQRISRARRREP